MKTGPNGGGRRVSSAGARSFPVSHRIRRINTEGKAKAVVAVWGTEFINFFAALAIVHLNDLNNRMI